jgi:hypothetical protein
MSAPLCSGNHRLSTTWNLRHDRVSNFDCSELKGLYCWGGSKTKLRSLNEGGMV